MEKIKTLPSDIPIITLYALLGKNRDVITSVPKKTFQYGNTERHRLDVYCPPNPNSSSAKAPVLFFVYGGGFTAGDRSKPPPFDLIHACVAAFFALRGFITIIPDYRLAPEFKYPEAARDVLSAINWAISHPSDLIFNSGSSPTPSPDLDSLFIAGHSAGAVHTATLVFHQDLVPVGDDLRHRIKGIMLISGPYHFLPDDAARRPTSEAHWGTVENAAKNSPHSLLLNWFTTHPISSTPPGSNRLPKILLVLAENDTSRISENTSEYHKLLEWHLGERVEYLEAKGHNHVSIIYALSSGEGEEWAERAAEWMREVLSGSGGGDRVESSGSEILKNVKETDAHVCSKCQQRQTRSFTIPLGLESMPSKTFFNCISCGNRWI